MDNRCVTTYSPQGWYRFVGAAGTKMPTTRVPGFRCGTDFSGWLNDAHPIVEVGEVQKKVCFSDRTKGCKYTKVIFVKNCGSYFIYKFFEPPGCTSRYCSTDWIWSKKKKRKRKREEDSKVDPEVHIPQGFYEVLFFSNHSVNFIRWWCLVYFYNKKCLEAHISQSIPFVIMIKNNPLLLKLLNDFMSGLVCVNTIYCEAVRYGIKV